MSEHDDVTVAGFTQEEMDAWADETHRYKKKITAHVHGNAAAVMAAKAGFDSIEHGTMIEDDAIALMIENGVWLVPTVWIVDEVARRCGAAGADSGVGPWSGDRAVDGGGQDDLVEDTLDELGGHGIPEQERAVQDDPGE